MVLAVVLRNDRCAKVYLARLHKGAQTGFAKLLLFDGALQSLADHVETGGSKAVTGVARQAISE